MADRRTPNQGSRQPLEKAQTHPSEPFDGPRCVCGHLALSHYEGMHNGHLRPCFYHRPEYSTDCGCTGYTPDQTAVLE